MRSVSFAQTAGAAQRSAFRRLRLRERNRRPYAERFRRADVDAPSAQHAIPRSYMIGAFVQNAVEDLGVAEAHGAARVAVHAALSIHLDADQTERADRFVETTQGAERPAPYALGPEELGHHDGGHGEAAR